MINTLHLFTFGLTLWMGFYLLGRNAGETRLRWVSLTLLVYAVTLSLHWLAAYAPAETADKLRVWERPLLLLLFFLWLVCAWHFIRRPWSVAWMIPLYLLAGGCLAWWLYAANQPLFWGWRLAGGGMLGLLGLATAVQDAAEQGETLWPHLFRSFDYAIFTALLFAGQVGVVMWVSTGVTFPMLLLLFTTVTSALLVQTFADPLQNWLDRIAFFTFPQIRQTRAELREAATAVSRFDPALAMSDLDEAQFVQLTRRALSHMGHLPKLAANPLIYLTAVSRRLPPQASTLERAAVLKILLAESIERLKPPEKGDFGTTDEWRYYNALYFPYVLGLKPYSRRPNNGDEKDTTIATALAWFQLQVPERTLYNWQTAATKLIAQELQQK